MPGIDRLILGSVAVTTPELVTQAVQKFGADKIAVGIDARAGKVATDGWLTTSTQSPTHLIQAMVRRRRHYLYRNRYRPRRDDERS